MSGQLGAAPIEDWKAYLRWRVADFASPALSSAFVDENFRFDKLLTGQKEQLPRWKRCVQATDNALGEALGQEFVRLYFKPEAKARMLEMVGNLEAVMKERIAALEWMSDSTKLAAAGKLAAIRNKIGYPDQWRDYSALTLAPGQGFENRMASISFERRRNLAKIGKPVDKGEWNMTPPTVNAYYNPSWNEIVFPAGILQPPFFDPDADDALNYGAIGSVIGHEMTHGFDDQGSRFDPEGNLRDWWTAKDAQQFKARTGIVVEQFNGYVAVDTLRVNGKLTLGENIADLGGVAIAYAAFQRSLAGKPSTRIDGYTPEQRFFLGYARGWRGKFRPEAIRTRVLTDPHSPNVWRVNGPLSNLSEFAKAFGCKQGDRMVRSGEQQAKIW
jgi:putative endopeptidase